MSDNPARLSFPFHLGGPGTMTADKQFSIFVTRTLDCLGKNQDMIKYRVKMKREYQKHKNIIYRPGGIIIAGSKAEGLTSIYESDADTMFVFHNSICADNVRPFIHKSNTTVFQTDRHDSHAGYTKLKLVKNDGPMPSIVIKYSLFDNESEDKYLSSDYFVTTIAQELLKDNISGSVNLHERSGPSLPSSDQEGHLHDDNVYALRCVCPSLLQAFQRRQRPYNRPSCSELRDISVMDAHVVPVGHQCSNESHLEWRICFTEAEIYLVQVLNETESKLYIILKMVSKLLKFISKDITSYVMKNVVLWLVELNPEELFTEELLTYQLIQALRFLQKCVMVNFLPSYMIPERNLLAGRLDPAQQLKLTTFLSTLINEGGYLLLKWEKHRYGMLILYREPDMAEGFRKRKDMYEKVSLAQDNIVDEIQAGTGLSREDVTRLMVTDETDDIIFSAKMDIVCPEWGFLLRQGFNREEIVKLYNERRIQLLS